MIKTLNVLFFATVVYVNYLANALPINGYTTGELSDFYPNLFVPAGITFSIWGVIYLLLFLFVILQFTKPLNTIVERIGYWFIVNCTLNMSWIIAWHYRLVELSILIMLGLLFTLYQIYQKVRHVEIKQTVLGVLAKLPFSIYFAWICVATIANFTTLLVDWNFNPTMPELWASALIIVTQVLVWLISKKYTDIAYVFTIVWAIGGIIYKQTNLNGPDIIIWTGYVCILSSFFLLGYFKLRSTTNASA